MHTPFHLSSQSLGRAACSQIPSSKQSSPLRDHRKDIFCPATGTIHPVGLHGSTKRMCRIHGPHIPHSLICFVLCNSFTTAFARLKLLASLKVLIVRWLLDGQLMTGFATSLDSNAISIGQDSTRQLTAWPLRRQARNGWPTGSKAGDTRNQHPLCNQARDYSCGTSSHAATITTSKHDAWCFPTATPLPCSKRQTEGGFCLQCCQHCPLKKKFLSCHPPSLQM
ncbi:hypothetical protein BJV78DRAFT_1235706 [Lactifluus subvellereus]|nr:hypothetical protein BJV78DRAFT_1235706 [Lactifluus subvellereus]